MDTVEEAASVEEDGEGDVPPTPSDGPDERDRMVPNGVEDEL